MTGNLKIDTGDRGFGRVVGYLAPGCRKDNITPFDVRGGSRTSY